VGGEGTGRHAWWKKETGYIYGGTKEAYIKTEGWDNRVTKAEGGRDGDVRVGRGLGGSE